MTYWDRAKAFLSDQKGATAVEYGVVLAFIVLAAIITILVLEGKSKLVFNVVGNTIGTFGTIGNGT